jgi:hypothetical protein
VVCRKISTEAAQKKADDLGLTYRETSTKTSEALKDLHDLIVHQIEPQTITLGKGLHVSSRPREFMISLMCGPTFRRCRGLCRRR